MAVMAWFESRFLPNDSTWITLRNDVVMTRLESRFLPNDTTRVRLIFTKSPNVLLTKQLACTQKWAVFASVTHHQYWRWEGWQVPSNGPPCCGIPECLPNLSLREKPLLPVLDVFAAGWVGKRPFQGAAASLPPKMTEGLAYCSWTPRGSSQD